MHSIKFKVRKYTGNSDRDIYEKTGTYFDSFKARVSEDYLTGSDQWKVGVSSIFARAMRIQPSKDTFWTTSTQPGNPYSITSFQLILYLMNK